MLIKMNYILAPEVGAKPLLLPGYKQKEWRELCCDSRGLMSKHTFFWEICKNGWIELCIGARGLVPKNLF